MVFLLLLSCAVEPADLGNLTSVFRVLNELAVNGGAGAPVVPSVVHYFYQPPHGWGYMIMERILVRQASEEELCRQSAKAVLWLRAQKMSIFGSLGGGENIRHAVFQGNEAPEPFTTLAAVQTYLNLVSLMSHLT